MANNLRRRIQRMMTMIQNNDIYDWLDQWIWKTNDSIVILFDGHMKVDLYNFGMWQNISMLLINQLKTSDDFQIEQTPIDDTQKKKYGRHFERWK